MRHETTGHRRPRSVVEQFLESDESRRVSSAPVGRSRGYWVKLLATSAMEAYDLRPADITPNALRDLLLDVIPQQTGVSHVKARVVFRELGAFFAFLEHTEASDAARRCRDLLEGDEQLALEFERRMLDPHVDDSGERLSRH